MKKVLSALILSSSMLLGALPAHADDAAPAAAPAAAAGDSKGADGAAEKPAEGKKKGKHKKGEKKAKGGDEKKPDAAGDQK